MEEGEEEGGYHAEIVRNLWNLFTLWEVGNEIQLSILDEGLNYNEDRCKHIQIEKERTRYFMIDLLIFWKREAES